MARASPPPSLPTALSQALIAFTVEFDNEFEHRVEHRTSIRKGGRGVWLTSMVMWSHFMRLIPPDGVPLSAVEANARIVNFSGLQRWRYIRIESEDQTVHVQPCGLHAQEVWRPLAAEIEDRWRKRFGDATVDNLREALSSVADPALPLYLPVLRYSDGMRADHVRAAPGAVAEDLAALLSLLAFTLEYEAGPSSRSRWAPMWCECSPPTVSRCATCWRTRAYPRRPSRRPSTSSNAAGMSQSTPPTW